MKHADQIIQRVLFLEGVPNVSDYDRILVGRTPREQLDNDLSLEMAALQVLRPGVNLCLEAGDHATRELLEHIVEDEERHIDWIEATPPITRAAPAPGASYGSRRRARPDRSRGS